jgi:hypothetical protein
MKYTIIVAATASEAGKSSSLRINVAHITNKASSPPSIFSTVHGLLNGKPVYIQPDFEMKLTTC